METNKLVAIAATLSRVTDDHLDSIEKLQQNLAWSQAKAGDQANLIEKLKQDVADEHKAFEEILEQKEDLLGRVRALDAQLKAKNKVIADRDAAIKRHLKAITDLSNASSIAKQELAVANEELGGVRNKLEMRDKTLEEVSDTLERTRLSLIEQEKAAGTAEKERERHATRAWNAENKAKAYENKLKESMFANEELAKGLEQERETWVEFKAAYEEQIADLKNASAIYKSASEDRKAGIATRDRTIEQQNQEIARIGEMVRERGQKLNELNKQLSTAKGQITKLKKGRKK